MKILDFTRDRSRPIDVFAALAASNVRVGGGHGELHVYCLYFGPAGNIGPHPAGFAQLFLVVDGEGWVAGADGFHVPIGKGQGALFFPGEEHSKGSDTGMTVMMIQADTI